MEGSWPRGEEGGVLISSFFQLPSFQPPSFQPSFLQLADQDVLQFRLPVTSPRQPAACHSATRTLAMGPSPVLHPWARSHSNKTQCLASAAKSRGVRRAPRRPKTAFLPGARQLLIIEAGGEGVLPGRKSALRAIFWTACYLESTEIGPPAGRRADFYPECRLTARRHAAGL